LSDFGVPRYLNVIQNGNAKAGSQNGNAKARSQNANDNVYPGSENVNVYPGSENVNFNTGHQDVNGEFKPIVSVSVSGNLRSFESVAGYKMFNLLNNLPLP
jgi:hypothetical protein